MKKTIKSITVKLGDSGSRDVPRMATLNVLFEVPPTNNPLERESHMSTLEALEIHGYGVTNGTAIQHAFEVAAHRSCLALEVDGAYEERSKRCCERDSDNDGNCDRHKAGV